VVPGFDGGGTWEGHECLVTAGAQDFRAPAVCIDCRDFNNVVATVDGLFEPDFFHAAAILIDPEQWRKRNDARSCTRELQLSVFRNNLAKNSRA